MAEASIAIYVRDNDEITVAARRAGTPGCVVHLDAESALYLTPNAEERLFAQLLGRRALRRESAA